MSILYTTCKFLRYLHAFGRLDLIILIVMLFMVRKWKIRLSRKYGHSLRYANS